MEPDIVELIMVVHFKRTRMTTCNYEFHGCTFSWFTVGKSLNGIYTS